MRRYRAFFSYNHADKEIGQRLFNKVDGYRPPKALRGRQTPYGPVPDKLYPCFRDRDEEATASHIKSEIARILEASDHLVVLCSPNSARSEWVAWEIETFQKLGRGDRIHTVVVEGNPEHVFPKALQSPDGDVPLAADLRQEGDGWTDGTLKLIAGLLGVGFGDLKDREAVRMRTGRRIAAGIVGGFALLFVGACAAGWVALDRDERLQGALIRLLDDVVAKLDRATDHADTLTTEEIKEELAFARTLTDTAFAIAPDSPKLLEKQAKLGMLYADHYVLIGRMDEALKAARKSVEIADLLQDKYGDDPERDRLKMIANNAAGDVLVALGDLAAARRYFETGLAEARRLQPKYGIGDTVPYEDLAVSYDRLGMVSLQQGDVSAAEGFFRSALDVSESFVKLAPGNPQVLRDKATSLDWVGDVTLLRGNQEEAVQLFEESLRIRLELVDLDPEGSRLARDLVISNAKLGDLALETGDSRDAALRYRSALKEAERLVAADPGNLAFQYDLSACQNRLGEIAQRLGRFEEARGHFEASLGVSRRIVELDPAQAAGQLALSVDEERLGDLAMLENKRAEARERYQKGFVIAERLEKLDPANTKFLDSLARSRDKLAEVDMADGDLASAKKHLEGIRFIRLKLVLLDPKNAQAQLDYSRSYDLAAEIAIRENDPDAAMVFYENSQKLIEGLLDLNPDSLTYQRDLMTNYNQIGNLALSEGDMDHARSVYQESLVLAEATSARDPESVIYQRDLVVAYAQMAQVTGDKAWWRKALRIVEKMAKDGTLAPSDKPWLADLRQRAK